MGFKVRGLKEVRDKLRNMAAKTAKSYVRKAMREGLKPMLGQARADAPVKKGIVRRSLRITGKAGGKSKIVLRISMGRKMFTGKEFYGAFQELGHFTGKRPALKGAKDRKLASLRGRRFVPGKHFLRRAFDSNRGRAVTIFVAKLWEMIKADL